jgi:hypothetical protein
VEGKLYFGRGKTIFWVGGNGFLVEKLEGIGSLV